MTRTVCGAMGCLGVDICRIGTCPHRRGVDMVGNMSPFQANQLRADLDATRQRLQQQGMDMMRNAQADTDRMFQQMAMQQQQMQMPRSLGDLLGGGLGSSHLGSLFGMGYNPEATKKAQETAKKKLASDTLHLDLCKDFCTCGTPDPLMEGHAKSCPMMTLDIEILREVETLAPHDEPLELEKREPSKWVVYRPQIKWALSWIIVGLVLRIVWGLL